MATHLIIMVHGLKGSTLNWTFAATKFLEKYPHDIIIHCSECNCLSMTYDGVDVMGERLAEEIQSVVRRHPYVQKISFISHSLGGLIARYAIARLYGEYKSSETPRDPFSKGKHEGTIAGLEPINFITSATPHLGARGHKQVPVLCGVGIVEKAAARASRFLGRTGLHLFLSDGGNEKPPLLLQMVRDCADLKFMSALQSFKRRVVYANVHYDHLVGWSTSSLRRRKELPSNQLRWTNDKYPHIVNVETATSGILQEEVPLDTKECNAIDMEEEMIRRLTKLSWERVDVSFRGSKLRIFGHSSIVVKNYRINSDGADVIQHMVENFLL